MKFLNCLFFILLVHCGYSQETSPDIKAFPVNKKIKEFSDDFSLSSPLNSCITVYNISIKGKYSLFSKINSSKYKYPLSDNNEPDIEVSDAKKEFYKNITIIEYLLYKDSIACVISQIKDSSFSIRQFYLENGNWLNAGEDRRKSLSESRQHFKKYANKSYQKLKQLNLISMIPADTISFVNYIEKNGIEPERFLIEKLKKYDLVMFGEIHHRKASWDFLQKLVMSNEFQSNIGIIFMEMASNKQNDIDRFFANNIIDKDLLLDIFRDYMIAGWNDKGKFDFLISIWTVNKKLPANKQIRVIAVDTPRVFTKEGVENDTLNRDLFMANTILDNLKRKEDNRNTLFIVGSAHICKSCENAGQILTQKIPNKTYSIFTHSPRVDNYIRIPERIRAGMFDYAFYMNGDSPTAFELINSPFGKEPFDGLYLDGTGSFQDNYDGYIFLGSLDQEPGGEPLIEMYDDNFVLEIDRRYKLIGRDLKKDWGLKDLSSKAIIDDILSTQKNKRWEGIIKPLKNGHTVN